MQNRSSRDAIHAELEQGADLVVLVGQISTMINREMARMKEQLKSQPPKLTRQQSPTRAPAADPEGNAAEGLRQQLAEANLSIDRLQSEIITLTREC